MGTADFPVRSVAHQQHAKMQKVVQKRLRTFLDQFLCFLQRYLVVDLFALFDDDTLSQLLCGKADGGSSDLFAVY